MENKKQKKWCLPRHWFITWLMHIVMYPILTIKYGFRFKRFQHDKRNYLVLYNHQTAHDQFFVGYLFNNKTYYVTSDDLSLIPFVGWVLKVLVHIIPYKKASTDFSILRICRQVANEGGNICMAPEGNRTYSGKTGYINPTIGKMIQFLKLPVAFVNIKGGFGVLPRFSKKRRIGRVTSEVTRVWEYDEYKDLSYDEIYEVVKKELYVDESIPNATFKSKRKAEYIERVAYLCPNCGMVNFHSHGDYLECPKCKSKLKYNEQKQFEIVNGNIKFKTVNEWFDYQREELLKLKLLELDSNKELFSEHVDFYEIIPRKRKVLIGKDLLIKMYPNRVELDCPDKKIVLKYDDINSSGIFGGNKMDYFLNDHTYQLKYNNSFNALKYVQYYYKYKMEKGENPDEFFGI